MSLETHGLMTRLMNIIAGLPGLGRKSATRIVLHLLKNSGQTLSPLIDVLQEAKHAVIECQRCGNLALSPLCDICSNPQRHNGQICVVETVADLWAIERMGFYKGIYHVLGGTLSALEGRMPEDLRIAPLIEALCDEAAQEWEVIWALNSSPAAQMTIDYISGQLQTLPTIKMSRLACGIPAGSEINYIDQATLISAFQYRDRLPV